MRYVLLATVVLSSAASTPTDPDTGADLNDGRPFAPAGRPSAPRN